ncbi:hypothetical protein DXG01_002241 [Tephrocybe rancida]|nr:hypothetical protein DXG01_002241 [Tephrocybe rancida]
MQSQSPGPFPRPSSPHPTCPVGPAFDRVCSVHLRVQCCSVFTSHYSTHTTTHSYTHTMSLAQPQPDCLLMYLPAVYESPGQSFEEIRIADYLTSYRTSGRLPLPSTSLPPFKPVAESSLSGAAPGALGLGGLGGLGELRVYAYIARHKDPPPGTPMSPFVMGPSLAVQTQGTLSSSSNSRSGDGGISQAQAQANAAAGLPLTNGDQMLTISAQAQWAGHILEELRLAYLQSGRKLTSSEIRALISSATSSLPCPPPPSSRKPHPQPRARRRL